MRNTCLCAYDKKQTNKQKSASKLVIVEIKDARVQLKPLKPDLGIWRLNVAMDTTESPPPERGKAPRESPQDGRSTQGSIKLGTSDERCIHAPGGGASQLRQCKESWCGRLSWRWTAPERIQRVILNSLLKTPFMLPLAQWRGATLGFLFLGRAVLSLGVRAWPVASGAAADCYSPHLRSTSMRCPGLQLGPHLRSAQPRCEMQMTALPAHLS